MEIINKKINIEELKQRSDNPRQITDDSLETLKKSLREFPEMLSIREILIDEDNYILGGNQRYTALKQLGETEVPVKQIIGFTEEQKKELIIKDNVNAGSWDEEILSSWNSDDLLNWGVDVNYNFDINDSDFMGVTDNVSISKKEKPYVYHAEFTKEQYEEVMDVIDSMGLQPRNDGLTNRLGWGLLELVKNYKKTIDK